MVKNLNKNIINKKLKFGKKKKVLFLLPKTQDKEIKLIIKKLLKINNLF